MSQICWHPQMMQHTREPKIVRWKNLYWSHLIFPADACWPDDPTGDTVVTAYCNHMSFDWQAAAPPHMLPSGFRPAGGQPDGSTFRWHITLDPSSSQPLVSTREKSKKRTGKDPGSSLWLSAINVWKLFFLLTVLLISA